jgi:hypothetical protein
MKEKLLSLIHHEIEAMTDKTVFRDTHGSYYGCSNPIWKGDYRTKWLTGDKQRESFDREVLWFSLEFPDGSPKIRVYNHSDIVEKESIFKRRFFRPNIMIYEREWKFVTKIECGNLVYELTNAEEAKLIEVAKAGHQKYIDNKAMYENLKLINKIEMRLAKHQPKRRTSETVE